MCGGATRAAACLALAFTGTAGAAWAEDPAPFRPLPSLEAPPPAPTESPTSLAPPQEEPNAAPVTTAAPDTSAPPIAAAPAAASPPAQPSPPDAPPDAASPPLPPAPGFSLYGLPPLQVHGFASQGAIKSTKNNYLVQHATRGSFELTEAAINFTQPLTDRLRMGLQLFTSQIGAVGDFRVEADWYYLDYRFADWLGLRAGRTKVPFGLYNEINEIDAARVPILLPQAVYPLLSRDLLLAETGLELYGYLRLAGAGGLEYRLYGGTLYSPPPAAMSGTTVTDFSIPYTAGGRLMWETPLEGLRVGGSYLTLRANAAAAITSSDPTMSATTLSQRLVFHLWMASAEYARDDLLLAAEFGRWKGRLDSTTQTPMQPASAGLIQETDTRFYGMAAYRVTRWLMPGAYYGGLFHDRVGLMGPQRHQHDVAATLRFDVNAFWIVKVEGHYMLGTGDLSSELNGGTPTSMLADRWFVFLAKTTAYF